MKKIVAIISLVIALQFSCFAQTNTSECEYVVVTVSNINGTVFCYSKEKPPIELHLSLNTDSIPLYNIKDKYFKTIIAVTEYMDKIGFELMSSNPSEFFFKKKKNK